MAVQIIKKCILPIVFILFGCFISFSSPSYALTDKLQKKQLKITPAFRQKIHKTQIKKPGKKIFPTINSINPAAVNQGQTGILMISGQNLSAKMRIMLGSDIVISNFKLINDTGNMATINISVASDAKPGARIVNILYKDKIKPCNALFTVRKNYRPPAVRAVTPNTFFQGRSYTVILSGSNLDLLTRVDFGNGIKAKKKKGTKSSNSIQLNINVSPSAEPGRRIVKAVDDRGVYSSSASVIVSKTKSSPAITEIKPPDIEKKIKKSPPERSKIIPVPGMAMTLSGMAPNRWHAGKEYTVTVFGSGLEQGMQLNLGEGIKIHNINFKTSGLVTLAIQVDKKAVSGPRDLRYRINAFQNWKEANTKGFVISAMKAKSSLPKAIKHTPLKNLEFIKNNIRLKTPKYGKINESMDSNTVRDYGIPAVDDSVEFTWDEDQVGTSEWFELRILDKNNNILITRKIQGNAPADTFYIPDVAFLNEMFALLRPDSGAGESYQVHAVTPGSSSSDISIRVADKKAVSITSSYSTEKQNIHFKETDCYWQVAGYKQFISYAYSHKAGKYVMKTNDVENAVSERWPLKLPDYNPTGLICSNANTELTPDKLNENTGGKVEDHNFFVGDIIKLSGKISLDGCPWSIKYDTDWYNPSRGPVADSLQVKNWLFSNVFIDWGDGTYDLVYGAPTEEMRAWEGSSGQEWGEPGSAIYEPDNATAKPRGKLDFLMTHVYRYPQKFPVRLFVLPEQDAGRIDSIVQASKAPEGGSVYQGAYQKKPDFFDGRILLASSGMTTSDAHGSFTTGISRSKPSIMPGLDTPGSNAFLLYCQPMVIDILPDPFATGDLHLINISIDNFSGQKAQSDTVLDISGVSNSREKTTIPGAGRKKIILPSRKKNNKKFSLATQTPELSQNNTSSLSPVFPASDAVASSCDKGLYAMAKLEYFGLGRIILSWKANGVEIARTVEDVGPSPIRTELDHDNNYIESVKHGFITFESPKLPLDAADKAYKQYELTVDAVVEGYETVQAHPAIVNTLPDGSSYVAIPEVEYLKYIFRTSDPKTYLVKAPVPGKPCAFKFPVADGRFFIISNIQDRVTKKNGLYSGEGTLYFTLADSPHSSGTHFVEIHINNWAVDDGFTVTNGSIHEININKTIDDLPGVKGLLKTLKGKAGEPLMAVMDIKIKDSGLHRVGAVKPPEWLNIQADLVPDDGWYATGQAMPETEIYWSDFRISSNDAAIDLSRLRGDKPESGSVMRLSAGSLPGFQPVSSSQGTKKKGASQKAGATSSHVISQNLNTQGLVQSSSAMPTMTLMWAGVDLGKTARLYPFLFNLAQIEVAAQGWSITDSGIQGNARFNKFKYVLGDGDISFDSIDITAENHSLDAVYEGVTINIPWPRVSLDCGRATVHYTQGQGTANVAFDFDLKNSIVTEKYQNVTMTSDIKSFEKRGSGWGILTDTSFNFSDDRNDFAKVMLTDLFFNVYGEAHFTGSGDQVYQRTIPMNQQTTFGSTRYTLAGLNVFAAADHQKQERLSFKFNGQIDFHEAFNADDVKVFYQINKPLGKNIQAMGPGHSTIKICSDFSPGGKTLSRIEVYPEINIPANTDISDNYKSDDSFISWLVPSAHASSGVQDTFRGDVNAQMFGVDLPGVSARFRYGTYNSQTYWLTHLLGQTDITIFSGVNLKAVNGGIAHGFDEHVFTSDNIMDAMPSGSDTLYSAGITIGSPASNIYKMTGQLTVNLDDSLIRMDCNPVSLFGVKIGGGYFKYANSVFDGGVFGGFRLYNGAVSCIIPHNEADPRVGLHFGNDYWEIWAGKQYLPIEMKLLNVASTNGYHQFGNKVGYRLGGSMSFNSPKLCLVAFAARASADAGMAIALTPQKLNGSFWIGAKLHVWVPCGGKHFSFGPDVLVNVSAPPLDMSAKARFKLPKYVGGKTYTFSFDI